MEKLSIEYNVYNHIRTAILARKLAPGKQLVENSISTALGVSRTPIRNAIKRLALEGFVEIFPNRGAFVTNPAKEEMIQAYELRASLEYMAASKAMNVMTEEDFHELEKIVREEEIILEDNKKTEQYIDINKKFHFAITKKCNNKFLNEFIEKLINQTSIYLILFDEFFSIPGQKPFGPSEHRTIIQLMKEKNESYLKIIMDQHFKHSINAIKNGYKGYQEWDEIF